MRFRFHGLPFLILAPILSGLGWFVAFVILPISPSGRASSVMLRLWGVALMSLSRARFVVSGTEHLAPDEPRVLAANHSSYLDIPAMVGAFPAQVRVIAKRVLLWLPFIGWHLALGGHFLIDREDPRAGRRLLERAARRLREGHGSALVFVEGTRSADGRLGPLKAGSLHLALVAGVPVQPVAILGTHAMMPRGAFAPLRSGTVEVRFGAPIPTAGLEGGAGRKTLAAAVRAALLDLGVPDGGSA